MLCSTRKIFSTGGRLLPLMAILLLTTLAAWAQKAPIIYGEIPLSDLKMKTYDKDSSASAVILADFGKAYMSNATGGWTTFVFERHVRIKILDKKGLDWANAGVFLFHEGFLEERLTKLKASTYNMEGGRMVETEMNKDGVFKEKFNRYFNIHKFTLPNVKVGSVIEYAYTQSSQFLINFPDWQFQYKIPVRHSEYIAEFPTFFSFEKYMQGYIPPTSYATEFENRTDFQVEVHRWISNDVPAFKEEPFMTSEKDYVSKINLSLSHVHFPGSPVWEVMGTWSKLNTSLLESEYFGTLVTGSAFLKKKTMEVIAGATTPQEKVAAIYNYVIKTFEWDGITDKYGYELKKVFESHRGSSGDLNLLMASMIEKADVPVDMVVLSTRDHGFIRQQYPMTQQLNYVVCAVPLEKEVLLLDATDKYAPMGVLPERCLNGQGLVISKTRHGWINLTPKAMGRTVINSNLVLDESGALKGKASFSYEGYDALKSRKNYFSKGKEDFLKEFLSDKTWLLETSEFKNLEEISQAMKQEHELIINEQALVAADMIYLNPVVAGQVKENLFKLDVREYPVDFGHSMERMLIGHIQIPEGYTVETLPKNRIMALPNNAAKYSYNLSQLGNKISIVSILQINKSLFEQPEYPDLREFYNQLVAKQAEQIVIKRK